MRDQEIIGLQEAYLQVYAQPQEEVEQLDENRAAMRNPEAYEEGQRRGQSRRRRAMDDPHTGINSPAFAEFMRKQMGGGAKPKEKEQKEEVEIDIFDYLLEYLVAEGYADTNKAALAIMANMSEEWKQSIVEGGINFSVPSRIDDFNNRRDELKNRYKQEVGPRIPGPGGGGQYGEPSAPKATGVRLARGTSSSNRGTETKNNA